MPALEPRHLVAGPDLFNPPLSAALARYREICWGCAPSSPEVDRFGVVKLVGNMSGGAMNMEDLAKE